MPVLMFLPSRKMIGRAFAVLLVLVLNGRVGRAFAQQDQPSELRLADRYSELRPEQRRLVDDWFARFNRVIGKSVSPEEGYDNLPLSVQTTFGAVTHALLHTQITDSSGQSLGNSALDLVNKVDNVAGQIPKASGDRQFRIYVQLVPGAVGILSKAQAFDRKADNTVFHKGYPICFRSPGTPSIQFSISRDLSRADIDVDYRSSKFPMVFFNGHLTASNSDVRAGNNSPIHNTRWAGLQSWWRNLFGLPLFGRPSLEPQTGLIPRNPKVRSKEKPEKAVYDFLNSWLVSGETEEAVAYFSEAAYSCFQLNDNDAVDRGMAKYALLRAMQSLRERMGNMQSLADVSVGIRLADERLRVIQQPYDAQFVLYKVREDLAREFDCQDKLEGSQVPPRSNRSTSFGKYVGAVLRLSGGGITGRTVATLWAKEGGYWKLISYAIEPEYSPDQVPNTSVTAVDAAASPSYVEGNQAMIRAANDFLSQWLVRGNVDKALGYLASSCYACVNLYRADDVPKPTTQLEARKLLKNAMTQLTQNGRSARSLESLIVAAAPSHPDLMLVKHSAERAFAIVSVPDYMAEAVDCTRRNRGEEPEFQPPAAAGSYGNNYAVGFSFQGEASGTDAVFWTVWGRENQKWKIMSYYIITP